MDCVPLNGAESPVRGFLKYPAGGTSQPCGTTLPRFQGGVAGRLDLAVARKMVMVLDFQLQLGNNK